DSAPCQGKGRKEKRSEWFAAFTTRREHAPCHRPGWSAACGSQRRPGNDPARVAEVFTVVSPPKTSRGVLPRRGDVPRAGFEQQAECDPSRVSPGLVNEFCADHIATRVAQPPTRRPGGKPAQPGFTQVIRAVGSTGLPLAQSPRRIWSLVNSSE